MVAVEIGEPHPGYPSVVASTQLERFAVVKEGTGTGQQEGTSREADSSRERFFASRTSASRTSSV